MSQGFENDILNALENKRGQIGQNIMVAIVEKKSYKYYLGQLLKVTELELAFDDLLKLRKTGKLPPPFSPP